MTNWMCWVTNIHLWSSNAYHYEPIWLVSLLCVYNIIVKVINFTNANLDIIIITRTVFIYVITS